MEKYHELQNLFSQYVHSSQYVIANIQAKL